MLNRENEKKWQVKLNVSDVFFGKLHLNYFVGEDKWGEIILTYLNNIRSAPQEM